MLPNNMRESERLAARDELIQLLAERIVANALAEGRIIPSSESHEKRCHLRPVLNRPSTSDFG